MTLVRLIFIWISTCLFLPIFPRKELDCCARARFAACTKACYQIKKLGHFMGKLRRMRSACPAVEEELWYCIKQAQNTSKALQFIPHRACCMKARTSLCALECFQSKSFNNIRKRCNDRKEVTLKQCLNKLYIKRSCCTKGNTKQCKESCKQFVSSSISINSSTILMLHQFCESSPEALSCLQGYDVTESGHQYSNCCKYGKSMECRQECHRLFTIRVREEDLVSQLNLICGPASPQDTLYRCLLGAISIRGADKGQGKQKGSSLLQGQCCPVARSETCKTWCYHVFSRTSFIQYHNPLFVQCMKNPNEYELSTCIGDVLEPCKYGCKHSLKFCTNFNNRPLELFRRCDSQADQSAERLHNSWKNGDFSFLPIKIPVKDIQMCEPKLWKALACTLAIKPCSRKTNRNQICRSDCITLLMKCLEGRNNDVERNARRICMIIMPNPDQSDCITASTYTDPFNGSLQRFATFPCQSDRCMLDHVCTINEGCSFGRQSESCRPYSCVPGCSLGESATIKVRNLNLFKVPVASNGKTCSKVCQCFAEQQKGRTGYDETSCINVGCQQDLPCQINGKLKGHRSKFKFEDTLCTCFDGEMMCTKTSEEPQNFNDNEGLYCKCEADSFNPVCGFNGMTYPSICHARCHGLLDTQLLAGSCSQNGACKPSPCPSNLICMPHRRICLLSTLMCPQYDCVEPRLTLKMMEPCLLDHEQTKECEKEPLFKYCCKGICHEKFNRSPVCGFDGVTYINYCAAAKELTPVDYEGSCTAKVAYPVKERCESARCTQRKTDNRKSHIPVGGCCPIREPFLRILYSHREALTHIEKVSPKPLVLRDVLEQLSHHVIVSECICRGYISNEGDIIIIIQSNIHRTNHLQEKICNREAERISSLINTRSPLITTNYYLSIAKAAFIQYPTENQENTSNLNKLNFLTLIHVFVLTAIIR